MNGVNVKNPIDQNNVAAIENIEVRVQSVMHGRVDDLHLRVSGKGLILQGRAPTYYAKQIAQHAVMQATGLPILRNEIEVR
jgi:hypothetical protein